MSICRVILLLAPLIGGDRVLFAPVKPVTFKIISLLSDIIRMMPSFVLHCFGFLIVLLEYYLYQVLITDTNKGLSVRMYLQ